MGIRTVYRASVYYWLKSSLVVQSCLGSATISNYATAEL